MLPRRAVPALVLALLVSACGGGDLAKVVSSDKVSVSTSDSERAAALISEYRKSRGLGPVTADTQLNGAAVYQARAVAETGSLSHGDFSGRMQNFRIPGFSAENLSAGSSDAAGAIARWKASAGHNQNLLMPQARRIGFAKADTPGLGYGHYWALVLAQ